MAAHPRSMDAVCIGRLAMLIDVILRQKTTIFTDVMRTYTGRR